MPEVIEQSLKARGKSVSVIHPRLNLENGELLEKVGRLKRQQDELSSREQVLQKTLVSAQRMSDELKERSRAEAESVIRDARLRSERLLQDAQDQLARLEAEISRIFSEFFRASNARRSRIPGTGVGLAGVKELVERFDGELELVSEENRGSAFTVRLPLFEGED